MKEDILVYLLLPPFVLISTTLFAAFLSLLKLIDISAELSELNQSRPAIDYVILMLIIYYSFVALLISDSKSICEHRLNKLLVWLKRPKSAYGGETKQYL